MAESTLLFTLLPWIGGLNTSLDPAMIAPEELVNAENLVSGINDSKEKREGVDKDWDDVTSGNDAIIGGIDYWYLDSGSKVQKVVTINEAGAMKSYNADDGTSTSITVDGLSLSSPTIASMKVINNLCVIAMDKAANRIKKWSGSGNATDLLSKWNHTTVSRASSGTTKTVVLGETFKGQQGDYAVISGMGDSSYNGTYEITSISTTTLTNDTLVYTGGGSATEATTADTGGTIHGLAPNGSILQTHQGRLLTNDKERPYRVHYSETFNPELWGGYGDSGVIDLDVGDDDPEGVTAIFPTFQGDLYIAKRTKLYRIRGLLPDYLKETLTEGLGAISHEAVAAIDQADIIWVSEKGVHSLVTTDKFGDVEESYLSKKIQKSFNGDGNYGWSSSRRKYIKVRYLTDKNLAFVAVTESALTTNASSAPHTQNNCLWLFDTIRQRWLTRWPNISCESPFVVSNSDKKRLFLGSSSGRLYKTFTGAATDTSEIGSGLNIVAKAKSGLIYVDNNPYITKGYKRLSIYYTPRGTHTITVSIYIDKLPAQPISFTESGSGGVLGTTFTLGTSTLGAEGLFAPYGRIIDGYGRGIQVEFQEGGNSRDYSIDGFSIEYHPSGVRRTVNTNPTSNQ